MSRPRGRSRTCVIMEGYLTIPPDRGTILGRALWKNRYVVIGSAQGEVNDAKSQISVSSDCNTYLSIYKNPDDWEPSQQYAVSNITQCQVQMLAHRKQGPVLPTLILTIAADPATEKIRKRRSSRAATLVTGSSGGPTVLWFRTDSEPHKLHEWARCIQAAVQASLQNHDGNNMQSPQQQQQQVTSPLTPLTPLTPSSPSFQNPFVSRLPRDASEYSYNRPPSAPKSSLHRKASSSLYITRPLTISDSNSLRSRASDVSSLTSSATVGTGHHSELASPNQAPGEKDTTFGGFIEGWTSAQGRFTTASAIMSPPPPPTSSRPVRDSMGSNPPLSPFAAMLESGSSPPNPRETILDRAFQMNYIPGSENTIPGEEKLSSLARFEALMQQVDAQRRKQSLRPLSTAQQMELRSAWDLDEEDEEEEEEDSDAESVDVGAEDAIKEEQRKTSKKQQQESMQRRPSLQKSPEYTGRRPQTPQSPRSHTGPRSPISFNPETLAALGGAETTAATERPRLSQRTHSHTLSSLGHMSLGQKQQQHHHHQPLAATLELSPGKSINSSSSGSSMMSDEGCNNSGGGGGLNLSSAYYRTSTIAEGQQQRQSTASTSTKRLSFSEFTRRLSNAAEAAVGGSGGGSMSSPRSEATERADKCKSWRNSVGMFDNEGGFL